MMIKNFITAIALLFAIVYPFVTQAQLEKIYSADSIEKLLRQDKFEIDESAAAVVLYNAGMARVIYNKQYSDWELTWESSIKVLSNEAQNVGEIILPFSSEIPVKDIYFECYNLERGKISKVVSSSKDLITEKVTKGLKQTKFQIPNVATGSIIYYRYTYESIPNGITTGKQLLAWNFRNSHPTVHSRFTIVSREDTDLKGVCGDVIFSNVGKEQDLFGNNAAYFRKEEKKVQGYDTYTEKTETYSRNNILADEEEPYTILSTDNNERIFFYEKSPFGTLRDFSWASANTGYFSGMKRNLKISEKETDALLKSVSEKTANLTDLNSISRTLYAFVRDSIRHVDKRGMSSLAQVYKSKEGSYEEKAYLLYWLLNAHKVKAIPVITSGRAQERLSADFYDESKSMKIIIAAVLSDSVYYLDPSSTSHSFGLLGASSYNGFAWGITEGGLELSLTRDLLSDANSCNISITPSNRDDFNFNLAFEKTFGALSSYSLRKSYELDSLKFKEEVESSLANFGYRMATTNISFKNINEVDSPLSIVANLRVDIPLERDVEHFNCNLFTKFKENPFKEVARMKNIEFESPLDEVYQLSMVLPDGFEIDELPPSTKLNLSGMASFLIESSESGNTFIYKSHLKILQSTIEAKKYSFVRRYLTSVIEAQNRKITFRKNTVK